MNPSGLPCVVGPELRSCCTIAPCAVGGGRGAGPRLPGQLGEGEAGPAGGLPTCQLRGWGRGTWCPLPLSSVLWLQRERNVIHVSRWLCVAGLLLPLVLDQRSLWNHSAFLQTSTSPVSPSFLLGFRFLLSSSL